MVAKPANELNATLSIVRAAGETQDVIRLTGTSAVLGSANEAQVQLPYNGVEPQHAKVSHTMTGVVIEDLGSAGGTFCNEVRLAPGEARRLNNGDRIRLGPTLTLCFTPLGVRPPVRRG